MKIVNNKRSYSAPEVEQIQLDNEISLVLTSQTPNGDPINPLPDGWGTDSHCEPNNPMKVYDA